MGFLTKVFDFFIHPTHSRTMGILTMVVLLSVVFLTVNTAQQEQVMKQKAAEFIVSCRTNSDCRQAPCATSICLSNNTCESNYSASGTKCSTDTISNGACDNVGNCVNPMVTTPTSTPINEAMPTFRDIGSGNGVDVIEYNKFKECWGKTATGSCASIDFDKNGTVNQADYGIWLQKLTTGKK
jgi:hypothetical protein